MSPSLKLSSSTPECELKLLHFHHQQLQLPLWRNLWPEVRLQHLVLAALGEVLLGDQVGEQTIGLDLCWNSGIAAQGSQLLLNCCVPFNPVPPSHVLQDDLFQ